MPEVATVNKIAPVNEMPIEAFGKDGRKIRTPEFRQRMVLEVVRMQNEEGKTVAEACKALGLDTSGFYKWRATMTKLKSLRKIQIGSNGKRKIGPTRNEEQMRESINQVEAMKTTGMTAREACGNIKLGLSQYFKWKKVFSKANSAAKHKKVAKGKKTSIPADPSPAAPVLRVEARFCPNCGFHMTGINNEIRRTLGVN